MHNNYFFLRKLSDALDKILTGTVISECFSQHKDELIIRFETQEKPFYIKASLSSAFSCLSFPQTFQRARKNSIDLFPGIIGHRISAIRQFNNERSFALILEEGKALLFKMHGNRSNIILFQDSAATELFKNNFPGDGLLNFETLDRTIDWRYEAFQKHIDNPEKLYYTFGKLVWFYLEAQHFQQVAVDQKWTMIQDVLSRLEQPRYYITKLHNNIYFSLVNVGELVLESEDPIKALNEFFHVFTHDFVLEKEKLKLSTALKNKLRSSESYYQKNHNKLVEIENDTNYKTWADLLMANMHNIKPGLDKITLPNFYNNDLPIEIKIKKDLPPQKNAALFYKKAKNQHIEIERLKEALSGKEDEIKNLNEEITEIEKIDDLKKLRQKTASMGTSANTEKQIESLPFHEFNMDGFKIWVGRNAKGNDELTLKYSHKEDLWLHAKDVTGSHVVIKHQAGKKFPKPVIEKAAQLAAYNSKRKTESLCPVIVTSKKYVRKRKGDPAGAVVVEREEIIMVEPKL